MDMRPWHSVPADKYPQWVALFHDVPSPGYLVPGACPACGEAGLRQYYDEGRPDFREIQGRRYLARGALWQWCTACCAFEHSQSMIPETWQGAVLREFGGRRVTSSPEALDWAITQWIASAGG